MMAFQLRAARNFRSLIAPTRDGRRIAGHTLLRSIICVGWFRQTGAC